MPSLLSELFISWMLPERLLRVLISIKSTMIIVGGYILHPYYLFLIAVIVFKISFLFNIENTQISITIPYLISAIS